MASKLLTQIIMIFFFGGKKFVMAPQFPSILKYFQVTILLF